MNDSSFSPDRFPPITLVAAMDRHRVIGRAGSIPWRLPDDLRFFKRVTLGKPLIMGRKTFESIGRPLPGRRNIVLTRHATYNAPGCLVVPSLEKALQAARPAPEIMIAGGSEIYALFFPLAFRLYLTHVEAAVDGDTFFPEFDPSGWREILREAHDVDDRHAFRFDIVLYERQAAAGDPVRQ